MTANEMVKILDIMVTNKVNILNDNLDSEKTFKEQSEEWKRWFYELKGITIYAQNVNRNWHIELDADFKHNYAIKAVKIVNWK